ncbi:MAG: hypothetical protein M1839_007497 [Geoglossum umbratile]|nr:MAG: hypothetical protein M1839_007497 [Geoglossum umbratile]
MPLDSKAANTSTTSPELTSGQTTPYVRHLTLADVDACVKLENEVFPPPERCSREKFIYRLRVCPELSIGLFLPVPPVATVEWPLTVGSLAPQFQEILLAQTVSTKCVGTVVTDDAMGLPVEFDPSSERYRNPKLPGWSSSNLYLSKLGHQEAGQTLGLHSLAVLPRYQGSGYGKFILKAYIQRMRDAGVAKRIALIAHDHLIKFYKRFGFIDMGVSKVVLGGGGWHDMVGDFKTIPPYSHH